MNQPTCRSSSPGLAADCSSRAKEVAVGGGEGVLVRVRRVPGVEQVGLATTDDVRLADASSWDAEPVRNLAPHLRSYLDALDVPGCGDLRTIVPGHRERAHPG
jgi:hypothetical protein